MYAALNKEYNKISGFVAYAPTLMLKLQDCIAKQKDKEKSAEESEYVGSIGDKSEFDVTVTGCFGFESQYGYTYVNTFKTTDNNVLVWITSSKAFDIGKTLKIKATIKEHKEYKGTKQTVLTRVKEL